MRQYFMLFSGPKPRTLRVERAFFLGSRLFGSCIAYESVWWDGQPNPLVSNVAYFCPHCGEVWARSVLSSPAPWIAWNITCEQHGRGTLLTEWDYNYPLLVKRHFPTELLKREFLLYHRWKNDRPLYNLDD